VIQQLHVTLAQTTVLYFALVGIWGVFLAIRRARFDSAFRGALIIGVGLGVVQALVGVLLLVTSGRAPRDDLHYLYGLSVIFALPLAHQLMGRREVSRVVVYGLTALFTMGLALRAITTGA
jgi:heme A synthase